MAKRKVSKTIADVRQLDIFEFQIEAEKMLTAAPIPQEPLLTRGSLNMDQQIRQCLNAAIANSGKSRTQIAGELSTYVGRKVSKAILDSFTGAGRPNRLPADLLPALTVILGPELLQEISLLAGCRVMTRDEVILSNAGKIIYMQDWLKRKEQEILSHLPPAREGGA